MICMHCGKRVRQRVYGDGSMLWLHFGTGGSHCYPKMVNGRLLSESVAHPQRIIHEEP